MKKCKSCQREFENTVKFCTQCGIPLVKEEEDKKQESIQDNIECPDCTGNFEKNVLERETNNEPVDGVQENNQEQKTCPKCHHIIVNENAAFCEACGFSLDGSKKSVRDVFKISAEKVRDNEFLKAVKDDFSDSKSVQIIKNKTKETIEKGKNSKLNLKSRTVKIIASVVAVLLVGLIVGLNIHTCEECDEVYFGKKHLIRFFGEKEYVCSDCYDDFYSW